MKELIKFHGGKTSKVSRGAILNTYCLPATHLVLKNYFLSHLWNLGPVYTTTFCFVFPKSSTFWKWSHEIMRCAHETTGSYRSREGLDKSSWDQLRWSRQLSRVTPGCKQMGGDPEPLRGDYISLLNAAGDPRRSWKLFLGSEGCL